MAIINLDPGDVVGGIFSRVIFALILYVAAGVVGTVAGDLCAEFSEWSDFSDPMLTLQSYVEYDFGANLLAAPWYVPFGLGIIGALFFVFNLVAFWRLLFTEDEPWFWILGVAFGCTLGAGAGDMSGTAPQIILLSIFMVGYAAATWYLLKRFNPELLERAGEFFTNGFGETEDDLDERND